MNLQKLNRVVLSVKCDNTVLDESGCDVLDFDGSNEVNKEITANLIGKMIFIYSRRHFILIAGVLIYILCLVYQFCIISRVNTHIKHDNNFMQDTPCMHINNCTNKILVHFCFI